MYKPASGHRCLKNKHVADNCVVAQNQSESSDIHRCRSTDRWLWSPCCSPFQTSWKWTEKKNTEEEVKHLKLSPHFLRLLLDERLGDCLLPLLQEGKRGKETVIFKRCRLHQHHVLTGGKDTQRWTWTNFICKAHFNNQRRFDVREEEQKQTQRDKNTFEWRLPTSAGVKFKYSGNSTY